MALINGKGRREKGKANLGSRELASRLAETGGQGGCVDVGGQLSQRPAVLL